MSRRTTPRPPPGPPPPGTPGVRTPRNTPIETPGAILTGSTQAPVMPRVGGISQTGGAREAWTGGSNITPPTMPWNVYCRRPLDFRSAAQVQTACTKGLDNDEKLGAIDEHKNMVQLTAWIESLQYHMRNLGMDTVFKVITDLDTADSETDVLVHWSRILSLDIKGWIQALTVQGVPSKDSPLRSPVCPYDLQNLEWSGNFIMNSISQKL